MKSIRKKVMLFIMLLLVATAVVVPLTVRKVSASNVETTAAETVAAAEDPAENNAAGSKALAAGICVGLAALGGALGMGVAIAKSSEGISRQPEAGGQIRTSLMLGLVFIETAIIYALIVAILVIFVL